MEQFSTCWSDEDFPYLLALPDTCESGSVQDLTDEETAENWILSEPDAYCNTADRRILSAVLNDYDLETRDFFRWQVSYTRRELTDIIIRRSGQDIGLLKSIRPLKRGPSGRIKELMIEGDNSSMTVAKELMIRKFLSASHLRSSAFVVKMEPGATYESDIITLIGAGWGHGVGLCQIGAAVMSSEGADYKTILSHYYPGAVIGKCPINDEQYE